MTRRLGAALGRVSQPGDFIALIGTLGTGKTVLVQGLARGLNVAASIPVRSPSFTLFNVYPGRLPIYHGDLYRLQEPDDLEALGFRDMLDGQGVLVLEWADRLPECLEPDNLWVEFLDIGRRARQLHLWARGERSRSLLVRFRNEISDQAIRRTNHE